MEYININDIKTHNNYLRLDTNVDKLMKSIQSVGLIHPLVVNEKLELVAGGRRYTALNKLGHHEVPVIKISKNELEQELISIDENLVRKNLNSIELEKSLSRGKEIYEQLYPQAPRFEEESFATLKENNEELPDDKKSFLDITAEKTGLSKKVIKSAIDREEKTSEAIKKLRASGNLNATQTNELVKLNKEEQEKVAPLIVGKPAREIKELVSNINQKGIENAVDEYTNSPQLPNEYKSLQTLLTRTNKIMAKILLEEIRTDSEEVSEIFKAINTLRINFDQFLALHTQGGDDEFSNKEEYSKIVGEALSHLGHTLEIENRNNV